MYTDLASMNDGWKWQLSEDTNGGPGSFDGYTAKVFSNRHAQHASNFVPEIDLTFVAPAELRTFAHALLTVADSIERDHASVNED